AGHPLRGRRRGRRRPPDAARPAAAAALRARRRLRGGQRRERRRRHRHHPADGRRAAVAGSRRDHARQPHLPPSRGLVLPGLRAANSASGQLPARPAGAGDLRRRARRCAAGHRQPDRQPVHGQRDAGLRRSRPGARGGRRGRSRPGRHARRGDQREGGPRLAPRRTGHGRGGDPHARSDGRCAGAPRRHRLRHRRGDDRRARRRDRRQAGAVDRGDAHPHADALRALGGGSLAQRGADPHRRAAPRRLDRVGAAACRRL
ncbi:MAG: Uncharacterized protein YmdB, partial [uncultured Solirubrobacteraceae bacterium]